MFGKLKAMVMRKLRADPPEEVEEPLPPPEEETRISKVTQVSRNADGAYQPQFNRRKR